MTTYDEIKGMLTTIRNIQSQPKYGMIKEQIDSEVKTNNPNNSQEKTDFAVINGVEVEIHSEDPADFELKDDEKGTISQLIDDFRVDVCEIADFSKLHLYPNSAKLVGVIGDIGLNFTFSSGDDNGVYISNPSLLKIDEVSLDYIVKMKTFEEKFSNSINQLLLNRREN